MNIIRAPGGCLQGVAAAVVSSEDASDSDVELAGAPRTIPDSTLPACSLQTKSCISVAVNVVLWIGAVSLGSPPAGSTTGLNCSQETHGLILLAAGASQSGIYRRRLVSRTRWASGRVHQRVGSTALRASVRGSSREARRAATTAPFLLARRPAGFGCCTISGVKWEISL